MKKIIVTLALFLLVANVLLAQDYGKLNPDAPKELAQFSFLVGRWHAEFTGQYGSEEELAGVVDWRIHYVMNGYAIQDEWTFEIPSRNYISYGTMYRTYNPREGKWNICEQTSGRLAFVFMTAEKVGDTMVMYDRNHVESENLLVRRVFYDIQKDSFKWRQDISYDNGKTWEMDTDRMTCKRVE